MTKGQRKFRIALFGAIAAVAIAVGLALYGALPWAALFGLIAATGGGWAVHVTLSGQNSSITATNGGVVNKDTQGSPVTNTGSGDITHSIQHKGTGDVVRGDLYKRKGDTHIHIGITLQEYEAGLERWEKKVTERLKQVKQAHAEERRILEIEKAEIERRLADTQASYRSYVEELQERIARLESIRGQVPDELLDRARDALAQGDRSGADKLFAQVPAIRAAGTGEQPLPRGRGRVGPDTRRLQGRQGLS